MPLDVPNDVAFLARRELVTSHFKLLKTPLRQVDIVSLEQAARSHVPKTETSGERVNFGRFAVVSVVHDLDTPVVVAVPDSSIAVTRDFVVPDSDWSLVVVRVEIPSRLVVPDSDDVAVLDWRNGFLIRM